jgi:hypothetical protein
MKRRDHVLMSLEAAQQPFRVGRGLVMAVAVVPLPLGDQRVVAVPEGLDVGWIQVGRAGAAGGPGRRR